MCKSMQKKKTTRIGGFLKNALYMRLRPFFTWWRISESNR